MAARVRTSLEKNLLPTVRFADKHILHLSRLLSTPTGIDTSLSTFNYLLTFLHARLTHVVSRKYEKLAFDLAAEASDSLFPGEQVIASISPPRTPLSELNTSFKALSDMISEFRIFIRLWGMLGIYTWARDTYLNPPADKILRAVVWGQVTAGFGFQILENGAYLVSRGVVRGNKWTEREGKWWRWSSQFWLTHVLLEVVRLLRVRQLEFEDDLKGVGQIKEEEVAKRFEAERKWRRSFYANAAWSPLALHWSLKEEDSPVTETWIGLCGMLPGILTLRELWATTA